MLNGWRAVRAFWVIAFGIQSSLVACLAASSVTAEEWSSVVPLWEKHAFYCQDSVRGLRFPSKDRCEEEERDGDMVLFGGLLCAAGDSRGCALVKNSLGSSGQWYRSPRYASTPALKTQNSFSHDMSLGAQLYAVTVNDADAFNLWLGWLHANTDKCNAIAKALLRPCYCIDDNEYGCTMRPGDSAILVETVDYFHRAGTLPALPNGVLRGALGTRLLYDAHGWVLEGAKRNTSGYSQHLVGVEILLLRRLGINDPKLAQAAALLVEKNGWNPFFLYLRDGPTRAVESLTLKYCPRNESQTPTQKEEWAWERDAADKPWLRTMLWDRIFMARLLKKHPA